MLPLQSMRVIEFGHVVAGPTTGLILADLGADVIKVEPKNGEYLRRAATGKGTFTYLNRNKRSLTLDLHSDRGKEAARRLIMTADVLVENYGPGVLAHMGLDYEHVKALNPGIVYASVKGFLPGPYDHRRCLDEVAQMMGGLAFMGGMPDQPLRAGTSVSDYTSGMFAVIGILTALLQRAQTGVGQYVSSALFESVAWLVGYHMVAHQLTGRPPEPLTVFPMGPRFSWAVYDLFEAADGRKVFVATPSQKDWDQLCKAFDMQDLLDDPRLATADARVKARDWLLPRIGEKLRLFSSAEIMRRLDRSGLPFGPVHTPADLETDPHMRHSDKLLSVRADAERRVDVPSLPMTSSAYKISVRRDPPALGQHNAEILNEIGYAPEDMP